MGKESPFPWEMPPEKIASLRKNKLQPNYNLQHIANMGHDPSKVLDPTLIDWQGYELVQCSNVA